VPHPSAVLRSLLKRKGRRAHRLFLIEGPSLLAEALASGIRLEEVRATAEARSEPPVLEAEARGIPIVEVSKRTLASLSDVRTPPGLVAVAAMAERPVGDLLAGPGLVLLLAGIADPGNAGTLVRAAEAFGAAGVLFAMGGVDPYGPKVVRAAMGSLFRLPHALVEPEELPSAAVRAGRPIVAADRSGTPLPDFAFPDQPLLAVGAERGGVAGWLPRWDEAVAIPHAGPTESLNAGVAGAIILYAWSIRTSFRART
jgi:TrmH family RNA methyltransferase